MIALVGAVGLACASAAPPHAAPAALVSQPSAPVADASALPSGVATDASPDATAAAPQAGASASFDYQPELKEPDPFEPMNRGLFRFNQSVDHVLIGPIARGYAWLVPSPGRRAVRRVFANLDTPVTVANSLLQLEVQHAAVATLRFVLNSTVGVAGLFDPAQEIGLAPVEADFGQTLGRLGIGTGPYLVLPLLGPTTARDGIGTLVDSFLRPQTYLLTPAEGLVLASGNGITERDEEGPALEALEQSSIDFYAALRSAYFMHRQALVDGETESSAVVETAPVRATPEPVPAALSEDAPAPVGAETSTATHVGATATQVGATTQVGAATPVAPTAAAPRVVPAAPAP